MADPFVQLRNELLAARPLLRKYVPKNKLADNMNEKTQLKPRKTKRCGDNDPETFSIVNPKCVNGEEEIFKHSGKMYKRVRYGSTNSFLVHRGLNPPNKYATTVCSDKINEFDNKNELTQAVRVAKAHEAMIQRNLLGEESEVRRDSLKNMSSYKTGVVDDLVKQNRAKTSLILKNANRAIVDKREEMRDFYGHAGSTQVLAMRELQIEDRKNFQDTGIESGEAFFKAQNKEVGPSEYEEMVARRSSLKEKNKKIVDVLKTQALEKEMLKDLEIEENLESAERLDTLAEQDLIRRMENRESEERYKKEHFDTFNNIVAYREYLKQVRIAEDDALIDRENNFLEQKAKFNQAVLDEQNIMNEKRRRIVSAVRADLGSEYERQEQQDMEYYYTLQKERDIQLEDQEIQEKLDKKRGMEALMKEWGKITEANKLIKQQRLQQEAVEKERMLKFLQLENDAKKAEERKRMIDKDVNRMEIMFQINERERKRQDDMATKNREIKLLRAEGFVREGEIKDRMLEKMEDFKKNGLPERFLSTIRNHYKL